MAMVTNDNLNIGEPQEEINAADVNSQIQELTMHLLETEEQLEICQEEIQNMENAMTVCSQTIESLRAELRAATASRALPSPIRTQYTFTKVGSPSGSPRVQVPFSTQKIPSSSAAAPSVKHLMMALTNLVARQGLGMDDQSEPLVLGFGMKTAKILDQLCVGAHVHDVLRDISKAYEESECPYALCMVEGIGVNNSAAVAAAMRQDIISKLNPGDKGKGVVKREEV